MGIHIESDRAMSLTGPAEVSIEVSYSDGRHSAAPLEYETWTSSPREVRIKCYDAAGASVVITMASRLVEEIALGRIADADI